MDRTIDRRDFVKTTATAVIGVTALSVATKTTLADHHKKGPLFNISIAQWSLHKRHFGRQGPKLDNLDFAKTASGLGIKALEYVNQFFKTKAKDAKYIAELKKRADDLGNVIVEPGMRFRIVSKDGKWISKITVEKSQLVKNGIYLLREIIVSDLSDCESTQQQFDLVERIDRIGTELVGLKLEA